MLNETARPPLQRCRAKGGDIVMASTIGGGGDVGNGGDGNVVEFPKTPEERRALRKAKEELQKQRLINMFVDEAGGDKALFHTRDSVAYADLIVAGHRETWPVRSKQFRHAYLRYLQQQFGQLVGGEQPLLALVMKGSMSKTAVNHAIDDFERRAICSTITRDVHVRVAGHDDEIYIDLCNDDWQAVRVTNAGWRVVDSPPVRFRRTDAMLPLPLPGRNGKIETLKLFLNATTSDFALTVAFLLAALRPRGPYPVLILYGIQGSAKTNFLRKVRSLVDPHFVSTSALPASGRDLFIAAHNRHLQTFENVSELSGKMSDSLCRLATGGGLSVRTLFRDADETHFRGTRPIAFEGISNVVTRPDLQDRAIITQLEPLAGYETEQKLDPEFERQRPGIFGALLTMLARGLEMLPTTKLISPPRMADFAHWAVACGVTDFEATYAANRQNAINVMLSHDDLAKAVRATVTEKGWFAGTMQNLLDIVGPVTGIKSTKKLSNELRRLEVPLQTVGVHVIFEQRTAEHRPFRIELRK
jgi:hypothetical protein